MGGSEELDGRSAIFTEEQHLLGSWRWVAFVLAVGGIAFALWNEATAPRPPGEPSLTLQWLAGLGVGLVVVALILYVRLLVRVTDTHVFVHYRPLSRRTIPLSEIVSCEACRYRPIWEYGGWGLRLGRNNWAYTVSGREGVQLRFKQGRGLLIGSKMPRELAAAIQRGMTPK